MKTQNEITKITDEQEFQKAYQIANTIFEQIKYTADSAIMMCWGISKKFVARYDGKDGLFLQVNGFAHKGIVGIVLNEGKDLYEIHLFKNRTHECIKSLDEVFCEDLGRLIDELIEKPENVSDKQYSEQSKKAFYKVIFE